MIRVFPVRPKFITVFIFYIGIIPIIGFDVFKVFNFAYILGEGKVRKLIGFGRGLVHAVLFCKTCTKLEHTAGEFLYQLAEVEGVLNRFVFHRAVPFKVKALPPDGFSYTV